MGRLSRKTWRELLGAALGAIAGLAVLALASEDLALLSHQYVAGIAAVGAIAGGTLFRGELSRMAYCACCGALLADVFWSRPKFPQTGTGVLIGAAVGLTLTVLRDLIPGAKAEIPPKAQGAP